MTQVSDEEIKKVVRDNYAAVAQRAACCGPSSCCTTTDEWNVAPLYTDAETGGLPAEAVAASAGCGNPTALASLKPGETVMDFGSGGGIDCFLAAREVGEEGRVIGVDMTPDMVALARKNAGILGLPNVDFYLAEMEHTPVPDGSVDVIISNCVINLAPDKDAVFREAFRVLRPGGRVFISDVVLVEELPAEVLADLSHWAECLGGAELKATYLGRMRSAGFVDIETITELPLKYGEDGRSAARNLTLKALKPA